MSLLHRFAGLVALPLTGCVILTIVLAWHWLAAMGEAESVRRRVDLELEVGRFVHQLQGERGLSTAAAAGVRSLEARIAEARAASDVLLSRVRDELAASKEDLRGVDELFESLRLVGSAVAELRGRIDRGDARAIDVMVGYTDAIRGLLGRTERFLAISQPNAALSEQAEVYRRLLLYKEFSSRERGFGTALLGARRLDPRLLELYQRNRIVHEELLNELAAAGSESLDRLAYVRLVEVPFEQELESYLHRLSEPGNLAVPDLEAAVEWFEISSRRIDGLQSTIEALTREMQEGAQWLARRARTRSLVLSAMTFGLVLGLAWSSRALGKQLAAHLEAEQRHARRVEYLALHDPLTELPNRQRFEELFASARRLAAEQMQLVALHVVDVEDFAQINRIWGNRTGDWVLISIARRLEAVTGGNGILGRLYGDQFGFVQPLPGGRADAEQLAVAILATFEQPIAFEGRRIPVRARIGLTLFPPDGDSGEVLLRNADLARQHVVEGGHYKFYVAQMYKDYLATQALRDDLRAADVSRDFVVHYQPKFNLAERRVKAVEALVRWRRNGVLVMPGSFIREAEQTGTIVAIGLWVFGEACRQIRAWEAEGLQPPVVAVNLSAVQLMQADLVESLAEVMRAWGVDPRCLELEITESVLTEDLRDTSQRVEALGALGLGLAIDDFGTGHSSFTYLRRFPVRTVKVDQSFVAELGTSRESEVIVDTVIQLGHSLGLHVVAEGVETSQQLEMLREKACDDVQGYLLSPPLPAEVMTQFLRSPDVHPVRDC